MLIDEKPRMSRRACVSCRKRKVKCDGECSLSLETVKKCRRCIIHNVECYFANSNNGASHKKQRTSSDSSRDSILESGLSNGTRTHPSTSQGILLSPDQIVGSDKVNERREKSNYNIMSKHAVNQTSSNNNDALQQDINGKQANSTDLEAPKQHLSKTAPPKPSVEYRKDNSSYLGQSTPSATALSLVEETGASKVAADVLLLEFMISTRQQKVFDLPSYSVMAFLIDLYYRYIHVNHYLLPPKYVFLNSVSLPAKASLLHSVFASSCLYLKAALTPFDACYHNSDYWMRFVKKHWDALDEKTMYDTLAVLSTSIEGFDTVYADKIVSQFKPMYSYHLRHSELFKVSKIVQLKTVRQMTDKIDTLKLIWNVWKYQILRRVSKELSFPSAKALVQNSDTEFPENMPVLSDAMFALYRTLACKEFPRLTLIEQPSFLTDTAQVCFGRIEQILHSLLADLMHEENETKFLEKWNQNAKEEYRDYKTVFSQHTVQLVAWKLLEQVADVLGNYSLTRTSVTLINSRIKILELLVPQTYEIHNRNLLTISAPCLNARFLLNMSKMLAKRHFCSSFLLFKDQELCDKTAQAIMAAEACTEELLADLSCLLATCFELLPLLELGQGICRESVLLGMNYTAVVGPTSLVETGKLQESMLLIDTNQEVIKKHVAKPWWLFELDGSLTPVKAGLTWLQYPAFSDITILNAGLILASALVFSKVLLVRRGNGEQNPEKMKIDFFLHENASEEKSTPNSKPLHSVVLPRKIGLSMIANYNKNRIIQLLKLFSDFLKLRGQYQKEADNCYSSLKEIKSYCMTL